MSAKSIARSAARLAATGAGLAAGGYLAYAGLTWYRYGKTARPAPPDTDELLDRFMPAYEVSDRHHVRVAAPAAVTLVAASKVDLFHLPIVRAILKGRELILGGDPSDDERPRGLVAEATSIGWGLLAEVPGREVVFGAVTRPWEANVTFRPLPPDRFAAFDEPDYAKIAWTLRADPIDESESIFRTETRVTTTDAAARAKFRRYWAFLSPGIITIRWASLAAVRKNAERHAQAH